MAKFLSFDFYPKAVYFECKFWRLESAGCRSQAIVTGHCFTVTEKAQTFTKMLTLGLNIIF